MTSACLSKVTVLNLPVQRVKLPGQKVRWHRVKGLSLQDTLRNLDPQVLQILLETSSPMPVLDQRKGLGPRALRNKAMDSSLQSLQGRVPLDRLSDAGLKALQAKVKKALNRKAHPGRCPLNKSSWALKALQGKVKDSSRKAQRGKALRDKLNDLGLEAHWGKVED